MILDIDASLVRASTRRTKTAPPPDFKGGVAGLHDDVLFLPDATAARQLRAARLRPGNAGSGSIDAADNLEVLDDRQWKPASTADVAAGHCVDVRSWAEVRRRVMVRSDSAGCTAGFVDGCRSRNIGFAVVARRRNRCFSGCGS